MVRGGTNIVSGFNSRVSGGYENEASDYCSSVSGGEGAVVSGRSIRLRNTTADRRKVPSWIGSEKRNFLLGKARFFRIGVSMLRLLTHSFTNKTTSLTYVSGRAPPNIFGPKFAPDWRTKSRLGGMETGLSPISLNKQPGYLETSTRGSGIFVSNKNHIKEGKPMEWEI